MAQWNAKRLGPDARTRQDLLKRHAGPFADAAPALDAIMAGDLGAGRQGAQLLEDTDNSCSTRPLTFSRHEHLVQVPGVAGLRVPLSRFAKSAPNFWHQCQILSWVTITPRCVSR